MTDNKTITVAKAEALARLLENVRSELDRVEDAILELTDPDLEDRKERSYEYDDAFCDLDATLGTLANAR